MSARVTDFVTQKSQRCNEIKQISTDNISHNQLISLGEGRDILHVAIFFPTIAFDDVVMLTIPEKTLFFMRNRWPELRCHTFNNLTCHMGLNSFMIYALLTPSQIDIFLERKHHAITRNTSFLCNPRPILSLLSIKIAAINDSYSPHAQGIPSELFTSFSRS